jgi:hypothetical protein
MNKPIKAGSGEMVDLGGVYYMGKGDVSTNPWEYAPKGTMKELSSLKTLVREMGKIIGSIGDSDGKSCPICTGGINGWGHVAACWTLQNIFNRPEIKAIMEGE